MAENRFRTNLTELLTGLAIKAGPIGIDGLAIGRKGKLERVGGIGIGGEGQQGAFKRPSLPAIGGACPVRSSLDVWSPDDAERAKNISVRQLNSLGEC